MGRHNEKTAQADVVITTRNNAPLLKGLLESLNRQKGASFAVFVADDASTDETPDVLASFPDVRVLRRRKNSGPAVNRNLAAELGSAPYLIFFDDDVFLDDEHFIANAVEYMESSPETGQMATRIVSGRDERVLLDCGIKGSGPTFEGIFHHKTAKSVYDKHLRPRSVMGGCTAGTIVRRAAFEATGGFEPAFFYMAEDLDLSLRLRLAGWDVLYEPRLVVRHLEGQTMGRKRDRQVYLWFRNGLYATWRNFDLAHCLKATRLFLSKCLNGKGLPRKTDYIRLAGFFAAQLPRIIRHRLASEEGMVRPRRHLAETATALEQDLRTDFPAQNLILSVSERCNARCPMCFQGKDKSGSAHTLSAGDLARLLPSFRNLRNVVVTGGEPFLHKELFEICRTFVDMGVPILTVPSNGSLPDRAREFSLELLGAGCRTLVISLSLDGLAPYHDKNRGIPGLFDKVLETYDALCELRDCFGPRMVIQVNTCVTRDNMSELEGLHEFIGRRMPKASWVFEPVRGLSGPAEAQKLTVEDWDTLSAFLERENAKRPMGNVADLRILFANGRKALVEKRQPVPCCGGEDFITILADGGVAPCEMLPSVVNIRDLGYDINELIRSDAWNGVVKDICEGKCHCTHFCWMIVSIVNMRKKQG